MRTEAEIREAHDMLLRQSYDSLLDISTLAVVLSVVNALAWTLGLENGETFADLIGKLTEVEETVQ